MRPLLFIILLSCGFFACTKKSDGPVTDYVYAGTSFAQLEHIYLSNGASQTIAWDSNYKDKIFVYYNFVDSTIQFNVSVQNHVCQTFQEDFIFSMNRLNIYTANSNTLQASHTFQISNDSLYAYMLKYDGVDSDYTQYKLNFIGKVVQ